MLISQENCINLKSFNYHSFFNLHYNLLKIQLNSFYLKKLKLINFFLILIIFIILKCDYIFLMNSCENYIKDN